MDNKPDPTTAVTTQPAESMSLLQVIARAASDPSVDIEKMDRLLQMQERLQERSAKISYDSAFSDMQPELPVIDRRGRIEIRAKGASGDRDGNVQQSTPYALWEDINDAIKPVLFKYGFGLSFRLGQSADGRVTVTGVLSHREGHREETTITLQHDSTGSKNSVQAVGSSTSYGKRYAATALLNLTSRGEDDDGKSAGAEEVISNEQRESIIALLDETNSDIAAFCAHMKIESIPAMPARIYQRAVAAIEAKRSKK